MEQPPKVKLVLKVLPLYDGIRDIFPSNPTSNNGNGLLISPITPEKLRQMEYSPNANTTKVNTTKVNTTNTKQRAPMIDMRDKSEQHKIDFIWSTIPSGIMTERFTAVLLHYSENNQVLSEAIKEWTPNHAELDPDKTHCICSHIIHENIYFTNRFNDNVLRIGNECQKKFFPDDITHDVNNLLKQMRYRDTHNKETGLVRKFRQCSVCGNHRIPIDSPKWFVTCRSCYKKGERGSSDAIIIIDGKTCIDCNKQVLEKHSPFNRCLSCYKKNSETKLNMSYQSPDKILGYD
jgi:hypothetical protein